MTDRDPHRAPRLALLLILAAGLALPGCSVNPSTGRNQFILFSANEVNAMGVAAMPELVAAYGGAYPSAPVAGYVSGLGRSLADLTVGEYPALPWEFTVLDDDVVNAFALPGGKVFVLRGLMQRMNNEAQLAGVLGHEIGHVTARHVDERLSQAAAWEMGLQIIGTATESQLAQVGAALGAQGYLLKFGREQELEADRQGVKYMAQAGYDPAGLRQLLGILAESSSSSRPPELLSTHPYPERRIAQLDEMLAGPYRYTQTEGGYALHEERYRSGALRHLPALDPDTAAAPGPAGWCALCAASAPPGDTVSP